MTIAEPDPRWAELGAQACVTLAPLFTAIEHIGDTAVPGLPAKPLIDLMAATDDLDDVNDDALETLGYRIQPAETPGQLLYRREDYDSTAYRLHVVTTDTWNTRGERLLRDYLLAHPEARDRYATGKRDLMRRFGPGEAYTRGKAELLRELTDAARVAAGLPPLPVRDE
ncbi:GrpB family protein [Actinoplanes sp. NPDC051346]|uniref:GrpB family protein n=1 Tax=Actinoplanes sp. NPDC051346 TaxID=3155048 RepID=UPI00343E359A